MKSLNFVYFNNLFWYNAKKYHRTPELIGKMNLLLLVEYKLAYKQKKNMPNLKTKKTEIIVGELR